MYNKLLLDEEEPDWGRVGLGHSAAGRRKSMHNGSERAMSSECWRNRQLHCGWTQRGER